MQERDAAPDGLIERIVRHLVSWELVGPAVAFVQVNKPLSFVGSQALLIVQPVVDALLARPVMDDWVALFADREQVERLITQLEGANQTSVPASDSWSELG